VRKLPVDWPNPLTPEVVGAKGAKDPLRVDRLPLADRVALARAMDRWQLCQFALSLVLPLRPDEAEGLLVSDVDFERGWLTFGTRIGGGDFNCCRFPMSYGRSSGSALPLGRKDRCCERGLRGRPVASSSRRRN
jgi:hypothetical protein